MCYKTVLVSLNEIDRLDPLLEVVTDLVPEADAHVIGLYVIGEIFDRVYSLADVLSPPAQGIQTVTVPAGGATIVEFKLDVPGNYILVDHALSRAERGLVGILQAEGPPNPDIFEGQVDSASGH